MVVDAFTDLVFTPDNNHRHVSLLGLTNDENDTTQPTDSKVLSPSPREIGPLSFLHSPRYLLSFPNAILEQAVTSPHVQSSPDAVLLPFRSALPPLTPLADFSTPQGGGMISPYGSLNPSLLMDTPKSLSRDQENDKLPLAETDTLKENDADRKETDQSNKPSTEQAQRPEVCNREDKKEADHGETRFSFSHGNNVLPIRENPPDVRRRLFDEGIDKMTPATTHSERHFHEAVDPFLVEPQWTRRKRTGLKSRITPPPPIAIPTNPFAKNLIQEMQKEQTIVAENESRLVQGISSMPHASSSHVETQDTLQLERPALIPQRIEETVHIPTVLQSGKSFSHTKAKEKIPVMTSEASSVLAELKRQRSQVEAVRKKASSIAIPKSLKVSGPNERTCCNCKASQCIKRYCPCFATSNFCGPDCGCRNCENKLNNSSCVGIARKALMERDPNAFVPRIRSSQRQKARGRQTIRGCNCRKGCEKNYCICKENGLACGVRCTCTGPNGCQNQDQSKLSDVQQVIENIPPLEHVDSGAHDTRALEIYAAAQPSQVKRKNQNGIQVKAGTFVPQVSSSYVSDHPKTSAKSVGVDYPTLPTPTTPSMPYNPFFGHVRSNKKRSMTFGELSNGFKRIKVAKSKDSSLPELKQSIPKFVAQPISGLQTGIKANRVLERPMTSKRLSTATPPADQREPLACHSIPVNTGNGNDHLMTQETRSQHFPRILRYKFGSGKSASPFEYLR